MEFDDYAKYVKFMKTRTGLKRVKSPIVLADDWYYLNMLIIFKRYNLGLLVFVAALYAASIFLKEKMVDLWVYIAILFLISSAIYVYILNS